MTNLVYNEQKKNSYNIYADIMQRILYEKVDNQEKRLTIVEGEIENLREELINFNNRMTNDNQFLPNNQNAKLDSGVNCRMEDKCAERSLVTIVSELDNVEDKSLQVQIVGELVDEIRERLKNIPKQKNNYRRQMLLMFHETLKQNYAKRLFSTEQVKTLIEVAKVCNRAFVTKEQYFKMDDILCDSDLDMMPNLE